jgi:hypothetical protein
MGDPFSGEKEKVVAHYGPPMLATHAGACGLFFFSSRASNLRPVRPLVSVIGTFLFSLFFLFFSLCVVVCGSYLFPCLARACAALPLLCILEILFFIRLGVSWRLT